ncbi:PREDICTED: armadillo repeat-containing protein 1-like [Nanorana parkeri]|uniref:armadillo repeat-containing protein 1-like n=1 Tax=Nanorana parkeri TaxID=125878 RepID=UPI00085479B8|nr:PREDICTED: armadillo repeat-containing protein 1-like [Nanorana parkeri]
MDAVSVVSHLRSLASEPRNRAGIVNDKSCLAGLILLLSHQDPNVVEGALQTICYLCENAHHCEIMRHELGMMVSLENIRSSQVKKKCLTSAIAETKVLKAQQVIKNESGKEVYLPMPSVSLPVEKNSCLPDYLPEEESPQKDIEKALARPALKEENSGSWFNAAANFLSKTFYW